MFLIPSAKFVLKYCRIIHFKPDNFIERITLSVVLNHSYGKDVLVKVEVFYKNERLNLQSVSF